MVIALTIALAYPIFEICFLCIVVQDPPMIFHTVITVVMSRICGLVFEIMPYK